MEILFLFLLIVGAVCFGLAAIGRAVGSVNLVAAGLLAWILVPLIEALAALD